jgi:hypothetical protein
VWQVKEWLGLNPSTTLGMVCPLPVTGKIAVPQPQKPTTPPPSPPKK